MNYNKYLVAILSGVTALSLAGLMFIQWRWLKEGMALNKELLENRMGIVKSDIRKAIKRQHPDIVNFTRQTVGEQDLFINADREGNSQMEQFIYEIVDSALHHYHLPVQYSLKGKTTDGYCLFYAEENDPYYTPYLSGIPDIICLCNHNHTDGSLDFTIELDANDYLLAESSGLLMPSLVFLLLLLGIFTFIIFTLNRQKKLSDLKNDFINNLTHEFKTPIFTIGLSAKMLNKAEPISANEKLKSYVDLISNENQRLKTQVDKVLQMAVINTGKLALDKTEVDLHKVVQKVAESFRVPVEEKGGTIRLVFQADNYLVPADETHLTNAIYNLVDNAYKYSPNAPNIIIKMEEEDTYLVLHITDQGMGMSKEIQQMIFDRFYRGQKDDRHNVKGFGLGLSYVKSIVELHKGKIKVNSRQEEGTVFSVYLPKR